MIEEGNFEESKNSMEIEKVPEISFIESNLLE